MMHSDWRLNSSRDTRRPFVLLDRVIQDVRAELQTRLDEQTIRVAIDVPVRLQVQADPDLLRQAVHGLMANALEAMPTGGNLSITAFQGSSGLELEVADSGPGLSETLRRGPFAVLFSDKLSQTEANLAIVHRIASLHGGDVVAANCPEGGAAFTLRIPQRTLRAAA